MKKVINIFAAALFVAAAHLDASACTGITLKASDGSNITARTIEWSGSKLTNRYVVVPRGHQYTSYTPTGQNGITFSAKHGFVGVAIMDDNFVVEGINELGLSAGLFYFPNYGSYPPYNAENNERTIADMQLVSWMLSQFSTLEEVRAALPLVDLVSVAGSSTVHWRVTEASGKQIVIEYINGECRIYDNQVGVLTNSPAFDWQMTNLNNYVNLFAGAASPREYDNDVVLRPFGAGSGLLGLPGDMTPPSRFVRAFFLSSSAPAVESGEECVMQAFQLLNSFDIPMGLIHNGLNEAEIPSSTQWVAATDITNCKFYYRTMYNSAIRTIDLTTIDFGSVKFFSRLLDTTEQTPIESVPVM
ncbi:MAG: choloylglycine hydrolase family protein [Rikenellaceae bacterium]